jgi:hypothetical protein
VHLLQLVVAQVPVSRHDFPGQNRAAPCAALAGRDPLVVNDVVAKKTEVVEEIGLDVACALTP